MESKTYYFEENRPENTDIVLDLVRKRALERGIKHIVVASTHGETGVKAAEALKGSGLNVVVVTHQIGPEGKELLEENEKKMMDLGVKIVTCTHAFGGVGSSLRRAPPRPPMPQQLSGPFQQMPQPSWPAYVPPIGELVANVLRLFSAGMKVCFEITLMAADAGAIPSGENVIAVAGQHSGVNTAIVIKSANTINLFDLDAQEIIAKPIRKTLPRQ